MISLEAVRAVVERRWSEEFAEVPTAYGDQHVAVDRLPAWAELWVSTADFRAGRLASPERVDVSVTVHLFVRDASEPRRIDRLVDAAKAALCPLDIVAETVRVSLREFAIRDLSRSQADRDERTVRHVVVVASGVAEEVCVAVD